MSMLPFRIEFTQRAIDDLHRRIDATRWPEVPWDTGWTTGTNDAVLRELVTYWRRDYDWFAWQDRLNQRAHIRGPIDGEPKPAIKHHVLDQGNIRYLVCGCNAR
jgi:epoxide hydrolase